MNFNLDINKQAQEVIFFRKLQKSNYPSLTFNGTGVTPLEIHKHLKMFLDSKLDFKEHIQNVPKKISKTIGLLRKLQKTVPTPPLITIYKSSIKLYLDYGDIIYYQAYTVSFHQKIEPIQYNAALAITRAIRGTSTIVCKNFWKNTKICQFCSNISNSSPLPPINVEWLCFLELQAQLNSTLIWGKGENWFIQNIFAHDYLNLVGVNSENFF